MAKFAELYDVLQSVKKLKDLEIPEGRISVADISKGPSPELDAAMKGIQALIICTSAMPKMVSPPKVGYPVSLPSVRYIKELESYSYYLILIILFFLSSY